MPLRSGGGRRLDAPGYSDYLRKIKVVILTVFQAESGDTGPITICSDGLTSR